MPVSAVQRCWRHRAKVYWHRDGENRNGCRVQGTVDRGDGKERVRRKVEGERTGEPCIACAVFCLQRRRDGAKVAPDQLFTDWRSVHGYCCETHPCTSAHDLLVSEAVMSHCAQSARCCTTHYLCQPHYWQPSLYRNTGSYSNSVPQDIEK